MQPDAVADERDRRQAEFADLAEIKVIDRAGGGARFHGIEQEIFAGDEIGPDALSRGRRRADRGRAADAGMIAVDDRKDFDAADIAVLEHPFGRTDIRKDAALAG